MSLSNAQEALLSRIEMVLSQSEIASLTSRLIATELGVPPQAVEEISELGVIAHRLFPIDAQRLLSKIQVTRLLAKLTEVSEPFGTAEARDTWQLTRSITIAALTAMDQLGWISGPIGARTITEAGREWLAQSSPTE
jgi:hypothetical protein